MKALRDSGLAAEKGKEVVLECQVGGGGSPRSSLTGVARAHLLARTARSG